jgi:ketosteroid isomerase-like protein
MSVEHNKAVIRKYLLTNETFDLDGARACLADDVVQHLPAPGDYEKIGASNVAPGIHRGADANIARRREYLPKIYHLDTIKIDIQTIIGEGDYVSARWILSAKTKLRNEDYANHYHYLYRFEDGLIAEYWEYCDTAYGVAALF